MLLYGQKTHLPFCVLYSRLCPKLLVTGQVCPAATVPASMDQLTVGEREVDVEASVVFFSTVLGLPLAGGFVFLLEALCFDGVLTGATVLRTPYCSSTSGTWRP